MVEQLEEIHHGFIEAITSQNDARARHYRYPLLAERERYIEYLLRRGTGVKYIRVTASYMERIVEVMGLTQLRSITHNEIEEASAAWIDPACPYRIRGSHHGLSPHSFRRVAAGWFSFLGELETPLLPSFERMIQAFMSSRNVTPLTANRYGWRIRTFFRFLPESYDIQGISLAEIDAFVTAKLALGWKLHSIIGHCRTLRDFFHFAGAQGWCEASFYLGIRIPRLVSRPIEPKAPEWSEVRRLLRSFQKPTASDRRAKAMVMLCALYGLRSIEVFRLELGDIDWRNATFVVRRAKRGGIQHFPLLHEVGEAILDYLKSGRPKRPSRLLFLSMRPPYGKVSSTSLWRAIGPRLRDMGSRVDYVGAHCLRHACATRLLQKGASLQQIADFLGHRNVRSVDTYARLDMRSLRKVAAFSFLELT
jgi:integrase